MDERQVRLEQWLKAQLGEPVSLDALVNGASFRRFFRFTYKEKTYIAMDAPPGIPEGCQEYQDVTAQFLQADLNVPQLLGVDVSAGFAWMSDFGDDLYCTALNKDNADSLYHQAINAIITLQQSNMPLPLFTRDVMSMAMDGFVEYFVEGYLKLALSHDQQGMLSDVFNQLLDSALAQPQKPMHRDYHSQNLLRLSDGRLGIVDFQHAKIGPLTYDLASLLRDCYIDWPQERVLVWLQYYYDQASNAGVISSISFDCFMRWFDWMGLERHLKACFTFARKYLRDQDDTYLKYLPRTLAYIRQVAQQYDAMHEFAEWLDAAVLPAMEKKI